MIYTSKKEILVDDDKYYDLIRYSWNPVKDGYVQSKLGQMHVYLMHPKPGEKIDHINNDPKDNRLLNLRISNDSFNNHNKPKQEGLTSNYIGVSKKNSRYTSQISKDKIKYYLGMFDTEEEAAKARDKKALELYGEHAKLNFRLYLHPSS